ncbi:MAG: HMA2 domain-containing protein, partial [Thermodesulfovibrionales bacterium]
MIKYTIKHHVRGRIRIEIPILRNVPLSRLKGLSALQLPEGIKEIKPNPFSGSVVITYEPSKIDIEAYL